MAKTTIQLIANGLAKDFNLSATEATTFVEAFFNIVSEELKNGNQVKIKGLGTFKVQSVKPRESVNVNTGERVLIEGHDKITFTPDAVMKELVNKPFSQFETVVINDGVNTEELERVPVEDSSEEVKSEATNETSTTTITDVQSDSISEEKDREKELAKETNQHVEKESLPVEKVIEDNLGTVSHSNEADEEPSLLKDENLSTVIEQPSTQDEIEDVLQEETVDAAVKWAEEVSKVEQTNSKKPAEQKEPPLNDNPIVVEQSQQEVPSKIINEGVGEDSKQSESLKVSNEVVEDPQREEPSQDENVADVANLSKQEEPSKLSNEDDGDEESSANGTLKKVALIAFLVIVCLGIFLWTRIGNKEVRKTSTDVAEQTSKKEDNPSLGTKTVPADTVSKTKAKKVLEKKEISEAETFAALNHDRRIRYGAYNIVGIERIVVLKKGETMEKYSRKTLGADMVGYFQVLNGCKTMQAGDTMKVPKVELRPEYRNR